MPSSLNVRRRTAATEPFAQAGAAGTVIALPALLLFISGIAALIYQVLWVKQLSLIAGVDVYAVTIGVSAFFAGPRPVMAFGNSDGHQQMLGGQRLQPPCGVQGSEETWPNGQRNVRRDQARLPPERPCSWWGPGSARTYKGQDQPLRQGPAVV